MTEGIYLLLGSNLADKKANLDRAIRHIEEDFEQGNGQAVLARSSVYETAAWGKTDQPSFFNQVIRVRTVLTPESLLNKLLSIEKKMGRVRHEKWGERIIDIDILYYEQVILASRSLQLPHPGIPQRRFTLVPLVELAPDLIHPASGKTQTILLEECNDPLPVKKLDI